MWETNRASGPRPWHRSANQIGGRSFLCLGFLVACACEIGEGPNGFELRGVVSTEDGQSVEGVAVRGEIRSGDLSGDVLPILGLSQVDTTGTDGRFDLYYGSMASCPDPGKKGGYVAAMVWFSPPQETGLMPDSASATGIQIIQCRVVVETIDVTLSVDEAGGSIE